MFSTFKNKEYVLTNLISLRFEDLKRGDVIVFKAPTDSEKDFIKRVIGISGDIVMVRDGYVYVNNQKVNETYLRDDVRTYGGAFLKEGEPFTVPVDNYIVMGDNRPYSSDSREWGLLKKKDVIGKSFFVYWPLNAMRIITNPF